MSETVGQRIKAAREFRYLTLSALARRAGIAKSSLHSIENDETVNVKTTVLYAIAAQLNVRMEALLGVPFIEGTGAQFEARSEIAKLKAKLNHIHRLSGETKCE